MFLNRQLRRSYQGVKAYITVPKQSRGPHRRDGKGRIIEEGNHNGLLEQGGRYATLYNTSFRHQSLAYVEKARELIRDE